MEEDKKALVICSIADAQKYMREAPEGFTNSLVIFAALAPGMVAIALEDDFMDFISKKCQVVKKEDFDKAWKEATID